MKKDVLFNKLKKELEAIYHIKAAIDVLIWDQKVFMPPKGAEFRAKTISELSLILHDKIVCRKFEKLLLNIRTLSDKKILNSEEEHIIKEVWREFNKEKMMPPDFIRDLIYTCSKSQKSWVDAKLSNDFKIFLPFLKDVVMLKRKEAELLGFKKNPYDAFLDSYEPYLKTKEIENIFNNLKKFLVPFLKKINNSNIVINQDILKGNFNIKKQGNLNRLVAREIGFDFGSGRLDDSIHPFTTSFNPQDVRITTRYKKENIMYSFMGTIHEVGHALYEQGMSIDNFGNPLGNIKSIGIHESQAKIWDSVIGKSLFFWKYFYNKVQKEFPIPFSKINLYNFYCAINCVKPSLIRTDADEVSYNLHIIIRFEIEKALLDGSIEVEDLPSVWNNKIKEYFGITVPDDSMGVLQDIHWASGLFGYFPTYTLGNLYAAQLYHAAQKNMENLEENLSLGKFFSLRDWLKNKIYVHGGLYSSMDLIEKATGEKLNSQYFINYIKEKYSNIYNI